MPFPSYEDEGFLLFFIIILIIGIAGAGLVYYVLKNKEEKKQY